jgi:Tfp pilus assembly protein PilX
MIKRPAIAWRRRMQGKPMQHKNVLQRVLLSCRSRGGHALLVRDSGFVLPIVLLISAMMLATSAAWFETSLAAARGTTNVRDYLQAFHAADSALNLCARSVIAGDGVAGVLIAPQAASGEPAQWKLQSAFEAGAVTPVAQWPGSLRAPQCLIEAWRLSTRAEARAYLLTSRGFGRTSESQTWLQMQLVIDGETIERHWRRVAARPF